LESGIETSSHATVKAGAATCPRCGFTTSAARVKQQMIPVQGGADAATLLAVLVDRVGERQFRKPKKQDSAGTNRARQRISQPELRPLFSSLDSEISRARPYKNTVGVSIVGSLGILKW